MSLFYEVLKADFSVIHNKRAIRFKEHMHKYIEILYVFEGSQVIFVDETPYKVDKGEAVIVFPDIAHSYYKEDTDYADELLIIFDPLYLSSLFPSIDRIYAENPYITRGSINEETRYAMKALSLKPTAEIRLAYTVIAFSNLLKQIKPVQRQQTPVKDLTSRLVAYIDANYAEDITREGLAREFAVSKYHISRIFTESFKKSLPLYLTEVRCGHAARLIRTTDLKLTAVARMTGFKSIRTFNRGFKEIFGVTPSEYKKSFLQ
ncbi:MAG: AraC family transcriptional regulator [Clostridiales bacterium]|nr:AraC family transcriptional regulator [Clostridiales bacterium]